MKLYVKLYVKLIVKITIKKVFNKQTKQALLASAHPETDTR